MPEIPAVELAVPGRAARVANAPVTRFLPWVRRRAIGPFVFLDHFGPVEVAPGAGMDVPPHPHIGLSTVTYLYSGENHHRDSLGTSQINRANDLNLMTAGRGVVHSERPTAAWRTSGGRLHGVQLWLGLPVAREEDAPSFEHHPAAAFPTVTARPGTRARILMGRAFGEESPVRHPSSPLLIDLELDAGSTIELPPEPLERAVLAVLGDILLGDVELSPLQMAVLRPDLSVGIKASSAARVLVLGGPPLDGPRYLDWNFVSSSRARLASAVTRWKERRFDPIPGDDAEFVPYPDRPGPPTRAP